MIRIIILAIGVFVLWVLFFSPFSKQQKIVIGACAACILAMGLWYESHGKTPKSGLIGVSEIVSCGASGEFSYRSNYNVDICLKNKSAVAAVQRIGLRVVAQRCENSNCSEVDAVAKEISLPIGPLQEVQTIQNLSLDKLDPDIPNLSWTVEITSVRATR
ncbi:MAG: hypothetical protein ACI9LY_002844 [Arenicella sp.]|jgi:hypothetical protein